MVRGVECGGEVLRGVAGASQLCSCPGDEFSGVGVVGSETGGVVFVTQPAVELVEQLRQPAGHGGEFCEQSGEFGGLGERVVEAGEVVEVADGFRGVLGELQHSGLDSGLVGHGGHFWPVVVVGMRPRSRFLSR